MVNDWQRCADGFSSIGPAVAYVGISMGMIFGAATVASVPTIRAAIFGVGGIPGGSWIDDCVVLDMCDGSLIMPARNGRQAHVV